MRARIVVLGMGMALPAVAFAQQGMGSIEVDAGGAKGEILMDGFPMGVDAPGTLENVPAGEHALEVEYGCMKATGSVTVVANDTAQATLDVQNVGGQGTLRMGGLPSNAEVFVDGAPVANIDQGVQVACGGRQVLIEAPGFEPWEDTVVVTTGKWARLEPALVQGSMDTGADPFAEDPRAQDDYDDYSDVDDELAELDELDDLDSLDGGRGGRDEFDDLDALDEFDDLDDRGAGRDEFSELDELDDLDSDPIRGGSGRDARDPREGSGKPFPTRGVVTGAGAAVAVTGIALTAVNQGSYSNAVSVYEGMQAANQAAAAQLYNATEVTPAKNARNASIALAVAGAGVGAAGFFLIEPAWQDGAVSFVPNTGEGGGTLVLSGSF
ncbi:MAG: PEGA domain-containing protein [Myxococcota bacterium]|nr:PEGA domain-containing protein [Myxococcota bacterium]